MVSTLPRKYTYNSSELSRNAGAVFDAASESPVKVNRRNSEDFILMTEDHAQAQKNLLHMAAQLIAVSTDNRGTLADRMAGHYPWMFVFDEDDRAECAQAILNAARASFSTGQPHLAVAELHSWKETAQAISDGLSTDGVEWLTEDVAVERP